MSGEWMKGFQLNPIEKTPSPTFEHRIKDTAKRDLSAMNLVEDKRIERELEEEMGL